jgi:hypothetical protein
MKTQTKQTTCAYPPCGTPITSGRTDKIYCCNKCKYTHNNEKKKLLYEKDYKETEAKLRHNVMVLKKLLNHPSYKDNRIERHYLKHEGFDVDACTLPTEAQKEKYPDQDIAWSHHYGIEVVAVDGKGKTAVEWITIHHHPKTNTHE